VKHLAATNHILAAAALGEEPPTGAGDEVGPETVRTKAEILDYLNGSFEHLARAIDAIGDENATARSSDCTFERYRDNLARADGRGHDPCF
jgi:hypothetical protein